VNGGQLGQTRILRETTVKEILTDQGLAGFSGGLAWEARPEGPGRVLWGHGGSDPGIRAAMYFDPQQRIGIAILSNTSQNVISGALDHVYEYCLDHHWPPEAWR
jgi:CubicO group peptidase (beta-lactamase class C family)